MPQLLRELVTIAEDQGPVPSIPVMVHNPRTRGPMSTSGFYGHQKLTQYTCVHVGKLSIYLGEKNLLRTMVNLVSVDGSHGFRHTHRAEEHSICWSLSSPSPQGKLLPTLPGSPLKSSSF